MAIFHRKNEIMESKPKFLSLRIAIAIFGSNYMYSHILNLYIKKGRIIKYDYVHG